MTSATPQPSAPQTQHTLLAVNPTAMTSGAERVLMDYLEHCQDHGWKVSCASPPGPLTEALTARNLTWHELPDMKLASGQRFRAAVAMMSQWREASVRLRTLSADADVVLTNGLMAIPALRLAKLSVPVLWLVHDVVVRRDLQLVVRSAAAAVDHAIAVSECSAVFPRAAGIPATVVLNGTPFPLPRAPVTMPLPPTIGVSGVLTPWKGHDVFLDAAALVAAERDDVRFELMGGVPPKDDGYAASLRGRAERPDLAGRVAFLGHVTDPVARVRSWSLAVSPSVDPEACPLNVLEAMSVGVPMVVTDHGGAAELIGDAGRRVAPRDAAALAAAMLELVSDEQLHRSMRVRGPAMIEEKHQIQAVCERFAAVLATRAGAGKRSRRRVRGDRP